LAQPHEGDISVAHTRVKWAEMAEVGPAAGFLFLFSFFIFCLLSILNSQFEFESFHEFTFESIIQI
jgi:hypothetical protein